MTAAAPMVNALFDLDGTLTDPGDGFVSCVAHALSRLGRPGVSPAEIRKHVGPPLHETLAKWLGGDEAAARAAVALYRERYGEPGYLENAVYSGVEQALDALRHAGVSLFVATSKSSVFARRILGHFGLAHYFQGLYGSEFDGTRSNTAHFAAGRPIGDAR